jgi:hypothetical protein
MDENWGRQQEKSSDRNPSRFREREITPSGNFIIGISFSKTSVLSFLRAISQATLTNLKQGAPIFGCQTTPGDISFSRQWSLPTRERVNRLTISELMTPADVPRNGRTLAGVFL